MMGFGFLWLVLLVVVVAAAALVAGNRSGAASRAGSPPAGPHAILRQRLAAGEIDQDEYRQRVEVLASAHPRRPSEGRWAVLAVLAGAAVLLAGLLLVGSLVAGAGMGAGGWPPVSGHPPMGDHMGPMRGTRSGEATAPEAIPDAGEVTVEAGEMWFEPATVEVTAGEPVNLTVVNTGQVRHDLTIDELDLRIEVASGQRDTAGLTMQQPGAYDFYCSVASHASAGMRGTLLVNDSAD